MMIRRARTAARVWREAGLSGVRIVLARRLGGWLAPRSAVSAYGPRFVENSGDKTYAFYISGGYGRALWSRLQAMRQPFDFIDIGANQGLYSIGAAENRRCRRIVALEPVPATARRLRQNLLLNGADGRSMVIEAALSGQSGRVAIHLKPGHSGAATLAQDNGLASKEGPTESIRTVTHAALDAILPADGPPVAVKIDVEGHEGVVVDELLKAACAPRISWIVCEVTPRWTDPKALREALKSAGFKLRKLTRGSQFELLAERRG